MRLGITLSLTLGAMAMSATAFASDVICLLCPPPPPATVVKIDAVASQQQAKAGNTNPIYMAVVAQFPTPIGPAPQLTNGNFLVKNIDSSDPCKFTVSQANGDGSGGYMLRVDFATAGCKWQNQTYAFGILLTGGFQGGAVAAVQIQ